MSLRDKLLSLLTSETAREQQKSNAATHAPIIAVHEETPPERKRDAEKKESPVQDNAPATLPDACPRCGSVLFAEITETVRRCLKKIASSPGKRNASVFRSETVPVSWRTWRKSSTSTRPNTMQPIR